MGKGSECDLGFRLVTYFLKTVLKYLKNNNKDFNKKSFENLTFIFYQPEW